MSSCAGAIPWNWRCAHKGVNPQPKLLDLPWHLVPIFYRETWLQRFFSTILSNLSPLSPGRFVEILSKSKVWRYFCNSSNEKTSFKFDFQTTQLALHCSKLSSLKRGSFFKHLWFTWVSRTQVPFEVVSSVNQMSVSRPEILLGTTGWKHWSYLMKAWKHIENPNSPNALTTGKCTRISGDRTQFVPGILEITKMLSPHVALSSENDWTTSMIQWL